FFYQAEDGIRDFHVTGVQTCALPILNIDYWIEEILDDDQQEEIEEYFMEAENDAIKSALKEFDGDYDTEELRLMRIKFISDVARSEERRVGKECRSRWPPSD